MCHCWAKASFNWAQGDEKLLQLTLPFLSSCTSWPKPTPLSAAACWKGIEGSTRTLSLPLQLHLSQHQQCQGVPKKHQLINNSHRSNTLYIHYKSPQYRLSGQIPHYIQLGNQNWLLCRTKSSGLQMGWLELVEPRQAASSSSSSAATPTGSPIIWVLQKSCSAECR